MMTSTSRSTKPTTMATKRGGWKNPASAANVKDAPRPGRPKSKRTLRDGEVCAAEANGQPCEACVTIDNTDIIIDMPGLWLRLKGERE